MLFDYHLHLEEGPLELEWLEQFYRQACRVGLEEIGFSEHCYRFREAAHIVADNPWVLQWVEISVDDYVRLIEAARKKGLQVKLGIEFDYVEGREGEIARFLSRYPWDYVIGSVHWINGWGFDVPEQKDRWQEVDVDQVYHDYFRKVIKAAESGLFDIMGHLDVVKVFGHRPSCDITGLMEEVAQALSRAGVWFELNTAGWRKPVQETYPSKSFVSILARYGVPVTLSSDAHRPEEVGHGFPEAAEILKKAGYDSVVRFSKRRAERVKL